MSRRHRFLRWILRRPEEIARDVDAELDFHVEMRAQALMRSGMEESAAWRRARAELGERTELAAALQLADGSIERRRARRVAWDEMHQDVRFAVRTLRSRAGFAAAAILTLALGIGSATAVFSVVDGVLLKRLPVADQGRLMVAWISLLRRDFEKLPFHYEEYEGVRDRLRTVSGVAGHAYHGSSRTIVKRDGEPVPIRLAGVTGELLGVLGVRPYAGRLLTADDDRFGAPPVMVLSTDAAARLFGSAEDAIGSTLGLDDRAYTIVGIAPAGFEYPGKAEAWAPATQVFLPAEGNGRTLHDATRLHWYMVVRVAPGFTVEQTRADLAAALDALPDETVLPGSQAIGTASLADVVVGDVRPALLLLGGAVLLVLLIAGVNVANLLLVRGITRTRELTLRAAIGASRGRILRQLTTESLVLVGSGAILAVPVGLVTLRVLLALAPPELPRLDQIGIDHRALGFTAAAAVFMSILFGVLPAVRTARVNETVLRTRDDSLAPGTRAQWLRHGLVVAQVAITSLVLSTAGLLLRSLDQMQRLELGFAARDMALVELDIPASRYRVDAQDPYEAMLASTLMHQRNMMRLAERVSMLNGVTSATAVYTHPFAGNAGADAIWYAEGQSVEASNDNPYTNYEGVDGAYFHTMDLPIVGGRGIEAGDRRDTPPVVVVNRAFADLYWPGEDPVGKRIKGGTADSRAPWRTVVGVAADARYRELTAVRPSAYVPYEQGIPVMPRYIGVRTTGDAGTVADAIRQTIAEQEPVASIVGITPLPGLLEAPLARPRFQSALIASFASLGLILSIVGTYGVLAFFVRQRTREIGIRVALGAEPSSVRRYVLRQGLTIGTLGVLIGLVGTVLAGRAVESLLFGVSTFDPLVLSATGAALIAATLAASVLPARQALRTDPFLVMRSD